MDHVLSGKVEVGGGQEIVAQRRWFAVDNLLLTIPLESSSKHLTESITTVS